MILSEVLTLAELELEETGLALQGWTVRFERRFDRAGACDPVRREILLSVESMLAFDDEEVLEVIRHEEAHALVGTDHEHDMVWRKKARQLGATGRKKAPAQPDNSPTLGTLAVLVSLVVAGFYFGPLQGVLAILIAIGVIARMIWVKVGPIEKVYKLSQ